MMATAGILWMEILGILLEIKRVRSDKETRLSRPLINFCGVDELRRQMMTWITSKRYYDSDMDSQLIDARLNK
jgi:hypothetical protein